MKTIFVVDDNDVNLVQAKRALEGHYRVRTMPSAERMFAIIGKVIPDLILLDIQMPEMDGFEAINILKTNSQTSLIPVMFLTASTDDDVEARGLEYGAVDFVTKPFSPAVLLNRIAHHLNIEEILSKRTERLERLKDGILEVVVDMVESRDKITGDHIGRTSKYIKVLIETMLEEGVYAEEMKDWELDTVISSARLHDMGKSAVPDAILNKPAKLTLEEFEEIKKHAMEGERIVDKIIAKTGEEIFLHHAKMFAGYHHEKWNGTGYPRGLKGDAIPLEGRIMAIADVYDALVSERPYKKAFTRREAEQIIMEEAGKAFDPAIVHVFSQVTDLFAVAITESKGNSQ
jgi:putative two-component system response regulator